MKDKILGLQKNVFFLGLTSFLNDLSSEMVLSAMPAFFISVLKSGAGALGIVEGIADATANLIKIYSGQRSDKISKRKIFAVGGYSLSVFTRPFYMFVGSVVDVAALRILDRVGKGFRDSPRDALISLSAPKGELGWSFGYHRAMDTLGGIGGPFIAYLILSNNPEAFNTVFMVAFVIGLLAIASLVWVREVGKVFAWDGITAPKANLPPRFMRYVLSVFVLAIGTLPVAIMLFKTQDLGIAISSIPLFYMVYSASFAFFSWPAGRFADYAGNGTVIMAGYLFLMVCYVLLALAATPFMLAASFAVLGFFSACTDGVQRSYVSKLVEAEHRGVAYGYLNAAAGFGALIAGVGGGFLWQEAGSSAALVAGVLVTLVGLVLFRWSRQRVRRA